MYKIHNIIILVILLLINISNTLFAVDYYVTYNSTDATANIQAGINSGADRVILEYQGPNTVWKTDPLFLVSNQELILEPGVILEAKSGYTISGCVLILDGLSNVTISGGTGSKIIMPIDEYTSGQWRHCITMKGCEDITIRDISLEKAGGDGIYIGAPVNTGITIENVTCNGNARNGISVISVDSLDITNCNFLNTGQYNTGDLAPGPRAGIDLEPNNPDEQLANIDISNCTFDNNQLAGIQVYLTKLNCTTAELSNINILTCTINNSDYGIFMSGKDYYKDKDGNLQIPDDLTLPTGNITFTDINVENTPINAIKFHEWGSSINCLLEDIYINKPTTNSTQGAIEVRSMFDMLSGNIDFNNVCILNSNYSDIALALRAGSTQFKIVDIAGSIYSLDPKSIILSNSDYCSNVTVNLDTVQAVGVWHMDEGTGSGITDSSSNNNSGTIFGADWTDGAIGGYLNSALLFNGTSDYVRVPDSTSLGVTGKITLEAWVKFTDVSQEYQYILEKGPCSIGGYRLFWNYSGNGKFCFATSNGTEHGGYTTTKNLENGVWYHIACVDNGEDVYFYLDGEQELLYSGNHTITATSNDLYIGRRSDGNYFKGAIDEVKIHNWALGPNEILESYLCPDIRANWDFNEGAGLTTEDSSSFGNDAAISGATWTTGRVGTGLMFDGINDYVSCGNDPSLNITGAITLETWVKFTDVDQQYQHIFAKSPWVTGGYRLYWNMYGNKKLYFATSNGIEHGGYSTTKNFANGTWYHIVCVDTLDKVYLYVNGEQETLYSGVHTITTTPNDLYIGRRYNGDYFNGIIDNFKIYKWALDQNEAIENYLYVNTRGNWHFDEGDGSTSDDSSLFGNDAAIFGATWMPGRVNTGLKFDGTDDYVDCGNDYSLNIAGPITFETWIKFSDVDQQYQHIFSKGSSAGGYRLFWNYAGNNKLYFATSNGSEHGGYSSTKSFKNDVWYHIVCVDTLDNVYLYVNGAQETLYSGAHTITATTDDLYIGKRDAGNYFKGIIDEFKVYNRVLNADIVANLYNK